MKVLVTFALVILAVHTFTIQS